MDADVLALVRRSVSRLSAAEARVAETILADPTLVIDLAINDLAKLCRTSLSTVARFAQSLGFSGYRELRVAVARTITLEQAQQARFSLDTTAIDPDDEPMAIAAKLAAQEIDAIERTALGLDAAALDRVARAVVAARHIDLFGQAASSLTAQDLLLKLSRIGCSVTHSADPHLAVTTAALRGGDDVAIAFSHSGETVETLRALEVARDAGALAVAVTSVGESSLALAADVVLLTHAHESPFRMAAMSSRIAQLALVDVLFVRVVQHRGEPVVISLQRTHDAAVPRQRAQPSVEG
ncbi:putative HTH-type transcriptional regulator YbbH [Microbacterium oxydans]|uniref:Putative HTH-type transcriptional regulator YbbH n=1 Tax=Microbacterium oxydans TaxID=82380 RepID=A0A0F0L966_9MICO|nr:MurR/RpiR family transcriptional regulator [Microbacterium oxydans]KJL29224.1 putative HTH-type transcriptional regulator YbbH [Microbacterium oxydans]CAH0197683.1 putative HTH-type transcriptional regulator YbbH [Microbacterium oxydans]